MKELLKTVLKYNNKISALNDKFDGESIEPFSYYERLYLCCETLCMTLKKLSNSFGDRHALKNEFYEICLDYESLKEIAKQKFTEEINKY